VVPPEATTPIPQRTTPIAVAKPPSPRVEVLARCEASQPTLSGLSGPKRGPFIVQINSVGMARITFYLDGRSVKTMAQAQAKGGRFTLKVNPRKLSFGAHKISIKAQRSQPNCAAIARSGVFVHSRAQRAAPKFTG